MHQLKRWFFLSALVTYSGWSFASIVQPNDGPYYQLLGDRTLYIYDSSSREIIDEARAYNEAVRALYDQSFGWKLDEREDFILTSPRQQETNAYATLTPNLKTVWYPSGAGVLQDFASSSWLSVLAIHETAHLYQTNAKGPVNSALKKVLGNSGFTRLFGWFPIFVHPNQFLPRSFTEGNAVMNESRFNIGGRLHSGEKRALVLAQIQAGDIDANRLINDEFKFPFGDVAYLQGGYFQAHLAAKYGVEKTNRFFVEQGHHFIWPFIINSTFREHFGNSFYQEVHEHLRAMDGLAKNQKASANAALVQSIYVSPLNHDEGRIFFLSTNSKQPPLLQEFDKQTRTLKTRQLDLPMGKLFFDGGKVLSAASEQRNLLSTEYSLYGEGAEYDPRFAGQIVTDWRAGKTAALDAGSTWLEPRVLVNGENYDVAHSHAILDEHGNIYYFRQNGAERIMYRNRQPLFKLDGFYAKPMEVTREGVVYFIANTNYGSTLYQWRGGEISRVLESDRVVDARLVGNGEFLVTEINANGSNVVLLNALTVAQAPAVYSYGFPSTNLIPPKVTDQASVKAEEREYNSFRELRFSSLELGSGFSNYTGLNGSLEANFTDPLQYQKISLEGAFSKRHSMGFAYYEFSKYLPKFFAMYFFDENTWQQRSGKDAKSPEQQIAGGVILPVLKWRRWDASVALALNYRLLDIQNDPASIISLPDIEETYGTTTAANLNYTLAPSLGFLPWRQFSLSFRNKLETRPSTLTKRYNTSAVTTSYTHGFAHEIYATLSGKVAWAERANILVTGFESLSEDTRVDRLTTHNREFNAKSASVVRLELQKPFVTGFYSSRIPIGLRRTAPLLIGQAMFFDDSKYDLYPVNTFEWGYGVDLEILLGHMFPMRFRFVNAYDTRNPYSAESRMNLNYQATF